MLQFVTKMIIKFIIKMETQEMLCYARKIGVNRTVPGKPKYTVPPALMGSEDIKKWMSTRGS